ncbi:MAG TPA: GNAT family N-acetyltransferase [Solirubrobacteraceae bacterium]|nr:GNAT family N-acetyltransferase [Solirubrobacteraceae bacterium]
MRAEDIAIHWAGAPEHVSGAMAVRVEVFCGEQGVPYSEERDPLDDQALHLVALEPAGQSVVATLRLLSEDDTARIGRVAVLAPYRHRGIASRMLELAVQRGAEQGHARARLAAQIAAKQLYEQAGFSVESEPFDDAGIAHVWMGRKLDGEPSLAD